MAPIEQLQGRFGARLVDVFDRGKRLIDSRDLSLQVVALGLERWLIDRAGQIGVEQPVLHACQFAAPLGERRLLPALMACQISQCGFECGSKPRGDVRRRHSQTGKILDDGLLQIGRSPTNARMVVAGFVVRAAIIGVLSNPATAQLSADGLARDALAAERTAKQAAGQWVIGTTKAAILAGQDRLAGLEGCAVDQGTMLAGIGLAASFELADVEAIIENVRERCPMKSWLALAIDVPLSLELIGQALEGHRAAGVEVEDPDDGL